MGGGIWQRTVDINEIPGRISVCLLRSNDVDSMITAPRFIGAVI